MAATTSITKLPRVLRSPSTAQYVAYKHKIKPTNPYFKPRFTFKREDREHTFLQNEEIQQTDPLLSNGKISSTHPLMPPYPYGANMTFPEANFGLYGGATIQSGSKISKGRNKGKTRRHWFPNVRVETVTSKALCRELKLPITARVMRTIKKCGGIDEYVTGMKHARIKELGLLGWKLRWLVMTSPIYRAQHLVDLHQHNLPVHFALAGRFEDAWNDESMREKMVQQQESAWQDLRQAADRFEKHVERYWVESGEKEPYEITKLESLKPENPIRALNLPEQLEIPERIRTIREEAVTLETLLLRLEARQAEQKERLARIAQNTSGAGKLPDDRQVSESVEDQIEGITMNMSAQELGVDPAEDGPEVIDQRLADIKEQLRDRLSELETMETNENVDGEEGNAEVLLADTAEEHLAKDDQQRDEHDAERLLEETREEIKRDDDTAVQDNLQNKAKKGRSRPERP